MPKSLERYQGRHPSKPAMFSEGFTAGRTRAEDVPIHFVRIGGFSDSHDATHSTTAPGLECTGCRPWRPANGDGLSLCGWTVTTRRPMNDDPGHP